MCTVTVFPHSTGYRLAMNRDEQRSRIAGLPPAIVHLGDTKSIHPSEPTGGTWISVNSHGVTVALINWYSIPNRAPSPATSRGGVVLAVRNVSSPEGALAALESLPLAQMNPFRLIGVFPDSRRIRQWQWNQAQLTELEHAWGPQQWISSGFDEPQAQLIRSATYRAALNHRRVGEIDWLRELHSSHLPERGPFATCMHRADAATVSYTETAVDEHSVTMSHCQGAPCCGESQWCEDLKIH